MSTGRLPFAITMGDPCGIGPEIVAKLFRDRLPAPAFVVGDAGVIRRSASLSAPELSVVEVDRPTVLEGGLLPVLAVTELPDNLPLGRVDARAGAAAFAYVEAAIRLALRRDVAGLVTAPINKVALKAAGVRYPGHTEILADLSAAGRVGMMLANDELRVMLVSIHVSLQDALRFVTLENVLWAIRLAVEGTRRFGVAKPRVAVAGLNPHAGEDGLFGHEEAEFIAPAVAAACAQGIDASGPWPPDTVFMRARAGEFDVVVAHYHDQGLIPLKYLGLEHGVNITVGLPFIRTSVDHGTAFDVAGLGVADHRSLAYALKVASEHVEPARSAGTNVRPS
jgi:4-hydroxythreonine-4-phosphate dehydrogenase